METSAQKGEPGPAGPKAGKAANVFARVTRARRVRDFIVLGAGGLIIVAALVILGEMTVWAAGFAALIMAAFSFAYLAGTADGGRDALQAANEAAGLSDASSSPASERGYRTALIEALPEPALFIDAQGRVEAANPAARRQFRILGPGPLLSAVVRRPELLDAAAAVRREGREQKFEFVERDETDRYFTGLAAPLGTGVLVTLHDITDIKRAEFARVDFLANASHELRTPLTSLAGFIETMRGPAREDEAARERFLEIMQTQAERMRRLISDLLSLSRIELVEHRPPEGKTDLASVFAEACDALAPVADERGVRLNLLGGEAPVMVTGARDELAQVAQNLIDNAIKYSPDGGVVEVEVMAGLSREEAGARAGRRWETAGRMSIVAGPAKEAGRRHAAVRVSDQGPGIARQYLPRLSERFYRVDPGRGLKPGTGLGLAIVKHVVQRHRGEFLVESEPGRGSAFAVALPMAEPRPLEAQ